MADKYKFINKVVTHPDGDHAGVKGIKDNFGGTLFVSDDGLFAEYIFEKEGETPIVSQAIIQTLDDRKYYRTYRVIYSAPKPDGGFLKLNINLLNLMYAVYSGKKDSLPILNRETPGLILPDIEEVPAVSVEGLVSLRHNIDAKNLINHSRDRRDKVIYFTNLREQVAHAKAEVKEALDKLRVGNEELVDMIENPTSIKITKVLLRNENKDLESKQSLDPSTISTIVGTRLTVPRNTVDTYNIEVSKYLRENVAPKVKLLDETSLHTAYISVRYDVEVIRGIDPKKYDGLTKIVNSIAGKVEDALMVEFIENKIANIKLDDFDRIEPKYTRLIKSSKSFQLSKIRDRKETEITNITNELLKDPSNEGVSAYELREKAKAIFKERLDVDFEILKKHPGSDRMLMNIVKDIPNIATSEDKEIIEKRARAILANELEKYYGEDGESETQLVHEIKAEHAEKVEDNPKAVDNIIVELKDDESNKGLSDEEIAEKAKKLYIERRTFFEVSGDINRRIKNSVTETLKEEYDLGPIDQRGQRVNVDYDSYKRDVELLEDDYKSKSSEGAKRTMVADGIKSMILASVKDPSTISLKDIYEAEKYRIETFSGVSSNEPKVVEGLSNDELLDLFNDHLESEDAKPVEIKMDKVRRSREYKKLNEDVEEVGKIRCIVDEEGGKLCMTERKGKMVAYRLLNDIGDLGSAESSKGVKRNRNLQYLEPIYNYHLSGGANLGVSSGVRARYKLARDIEGSKTGLIDLAKLSYYLFNRDKAFKDPVTGELLRLTVKDIKSNSKSSPRVGFKNPIGDVLNPDNLFLMTPGTYELYKTAMDAKADYLLPDDEEVKDVKFEKVIAKIMAVKLRSSDDKRLLIMKIREDERYIPGKTTASNWFVEVLRGESVESLRNKILEKVNRILETESGVDVDKIKTAYPSGVRDSNDIIDFKLLFKSEVEWDPLEGEYRIRDLSANPKIKTHPLNDDSNQKGFKKMEEDEEIQRLTTLRGGVELNYLELTNNILSGMLGLDDNNDKNITDKIMQSLKRVSKKSNQGNPSEGLKNLHKKVVAGTIKKTTIQALVDVANELGLREDEELDEYIEGLKIMAESSSNIQVGLNLNRIISDFGLAIELPESEEEYYEEEGEDDEDEYELTPDEIKANLKLTPGQIESRAKYEAEAEAEKVKKKAKSDRLIENEKAIELLRDKYTAILSKEEDPIIKKALEKILGRFDIITNNYNSKSENQSSITTALQIAIGEIAYTEQRREGGSPEQNYTGYAKKLEGEDYENN